MRQLIFLLLVIAFSHAQAQILLSNYTYSVHTPQIKSDKPPVLVMLHGYGSNEGDLFGLADKLDKRLMIISLRAPRITTNGGYCWYDLDFLPNGEFKYKYQQAAESKKMIVAFINQVCKEHKLDTTQIFLMGFSQGAILSYELAFSFPHKIKGIMALSGRMLEETKLLSPDLTSFSKINFFIGHGSYDTVIRLAEAEKAKAVIASKTTNQIFYKVYPIAHGIESQELRDIQSWLSAKIK